ncbi:MAG: four-carbon acid sugar kinase family protein [Clostridiales bacterium]|nr:four-carbon acid sugar kinase family protein [Clostridiales bacterium]
MVELAVIADDLTGALDTGVQFAKQGVATLVAVEAGADLPAHGSPCPVIVANAESRHLPAGAAGERVRRIARGAMAIGAKCLYKKTDSGLRGNIGAELEALIEAAACVGAEAAAEAAEAVEAASSAPAAGVCAGSDAKAAAGLCGAILGATADAAGTVAGSGVGATYVEGAKAAAGAGALPPLCFVPAYPKNGRATRGGIQYVDGVPLAESVFSRDPFEPAKHSEVARVIREQSELPTLSVPASAYCGGARPAPAGAACEAGAAPQAAIYIYDAETDDDMRALCAYLKSSAGATYGAASPCGAESANAPSHNSALRGAARCSASPAAEARGAEPSCASHCGTDAPIADSPAAEASGAEPQSAEASGAKEPSVGPCGAMQAGDGRLGAVPAGDGRLGAMRAGAAQADAALRIAARRSRPRLLAGCAGFAEYLPELLDLPRTPILRAGALGRALLVCGSVSSVALGQLRAAREAGFGALTLSPEQKLEPGLACSAAGGELARAVLGTLCGSGRAAIQAAATRDDMEAADARAAALGISAEAARERIARNVGELAWRVVGAAQGCGCPAGTLIVFGGDTLYAIMRAAGCASLRPIAELAPGIAASRMVLPGGSLSELSLITKSGGFGGEGAVAAILRALAG